MPTPSESASEWGAGASSAYSVGIVNGQVQGGGTKCRYRFRIAGSEAGKNYQILWEVWESDQGGTRFLKSEKTNFTGNGKNFQIVDGRMLDLPEAGATECQVGGGTQFVKAESIEVVIADEDEDEDGGDKQ